MICAPIWSRRWHFETKWQGQAVISLPLFINTYSVHRPDGQKPFRPPRPAQVLGAIIALWSQPVPCWRLEPWP